MSKPQTNAVAAEIRETDPAEPGFLRIRLATVSIVLTCVAVASLGALVIVATTAEADALSTVALALAVLAFAAQLIVSLAQSQESARQTRDTLAINADTKTSLAQIQSEVQAMVRLQEKQFDRLLSHALSPENVSAALLSASAGEEAENGGASSNGDSGSVSAADLSAALLREINRSKDASSEVPRSWEEDMIKAGALVLSLKPETARAFVEAFANERVNRKPVSLPAGVVDELAAVGLVAKVDDKTGNNARLTSPGLWAARLVAPEIPPVATATRLMRSRVKKHAA